MKRYLILGIILTLLIGVGVFFLRTPTHTDMLSKETKYYVALGDSVAAGVGLKYDSDASACDRTNQSYPNRVASELQYRFTNLACSGATLSAGIQGSQNVNQLAEPPQLTKLFSLPKPDIISVTIGANDANWTGIIAKCYTDECGTIDDTAAVDASLSTVNTNLTKLLLQIQNHYGRNVPRVLVTGYHQVFPVTSSNGCTDLTGIDATELTWGRQLQSKISATLQHATTGYSFATFVPINFSGHELCTADPWVQGLGDKDPYHPTAMGQSVFAQAILNIITRNK
jgi:lysophospholipase L1-like esterase